MTTLQLFTATIFISPDLTWEIADPSPSIPTGAINTLLRDQSRTILSVSPAPDYELATRVLTLFPGDARILQHQPDPEPDIPRDAII